MVNSRRDRLARPDQGYSDVIIRGCEGLTDPFGWSERPSGQ
jgi:hypothetical protein